MVRETVLYMLDKGMSPEAIATELGIPLQQVLLVAIRSGYSAHVAAHTESAPIDNIPAAVLDLYANGLNVSVIASKYGISVEDVLMILTKHDVPIRDYLSEKATAKMRLYKEVCEAYAPSRCPSDLLHLPSIIDVNGVKRWPSLGYSVSELSEMFKLSRHQIYNILDEFGILQKKSDHHLSAMNDSESEVIYYEWPMELTNQRA